MVMDRAGHPGPGPGAVTLLRDSNLAVTAPGPGPQVNRTLVFWIRATARRKLQKILCESRPRAGSCNTRQSTDLRVLLGPVPLGLVGCVGVCGAMCQWAGPVVNLKISGPGVRVQSNRHF